MESKRDRINLRFPRVTLPRDHFVRFVQLGSFEDDWKRLGMTDEDLQALEVLIMISPAGNPVVPGTGGLRKMRFARSESSRGKRGGLRIGYVYFPGSSVVTLLVAYGKTEQANFSPKERRAIKSLIEEIGLLLAQGA